MTALSLEAGSSARVTATAGFTKFPNEMFERFKPSTNYVWLALQSHAWMKDGARPTIARIMAMTVLRRTAVKECIAELVAAGYLTVTRRGDAMPNLYGFPKLTKASAFTKWDNRWWDLGLNAREAMAVLAYAHFSTLELGAVPGCRQVATMTGISKVRLLKEVVPALEAIGILEVQERFWGKKRMSNSYVIRPFEEITRRSPKVSESDPYVSESEPLDVSASDPLMYPRATTNKTDSRKTDPEEDSLKKTDPQGQRLRRGHDESPEEDSAQNSSQEPTGPRVTLDGPNSLQTRFRRHLTADPGTQVSPGVTDDSDTNRPGAQAGFPAVTCDITLDGKDLLADLEPITDEKGEKADDTHTPAPEQAAEPLDDTKADANASDGFAGQLDGTVKLYLVPAEEPEEPEAPVVEKTWSTEPWIERKKIIAARPREDPAAPEIPQRTTSLTKTILANLEAARASHQVSWQRL